MGEKSEGEGGLRVRAKSVSETEVPNSTKREKKGRVHLGMKK